MQDKIVIHIELFNFNAADGQLIEDIRVARMIHQLKEKWDPEIKKLQIAGLSDKMIVAKLEKEMGF